MQDTNFHFPGKHQFSVCPGAQDIESGDTHKTVEFTVGGQSLFLCLSGVIAN